MITTGRDASGLGHHENRQLRSSRLATRARPDLVKAANFLLATRDTGYKGTPEAIAELVDNSIQAGATCVSIFVQRSGDEKYPIDLSVVDDGSGMDASTLGTALTFGGSTRFGDRSSLGRYGMGLPNGGLSRARRIDVYTWKGDVVLTNYLDLDELVSKDLSTLPPVKITAPPEFAHRALSGTAVILRRCDRLEYRRPSTLAAKLREEFGRIYARYLGAGLRLFVNNEPVTPIDPLRIGRFATEPGGTLFGETLTYRVQGSGREGCISVTFSELPVEEWHRWSAEEKRRAAVTGAPNVFVVRAHRELDRGWFFMGGKRRENYDDWWRCEVCFDPCLDELFGLTHAKQAITPHPDLLSMLGRDLEPIARALNGRVRHKFETLKSAGLVSTAERQAARADPSLALLTRRYGDLPASIEYVARTSPGSRNGTSSPYNVVVTDLPSTAAFGVVVRDGRLLLLLNSAHPLYVDLYAPLAASDAVSDQACARKILLLLLAAARSEAMTPAAGRGGIRRFRQLWADVLATFYSA